MSQDIGNRRTLIAPAFDQVRRYFLVLRRSSRAYGVPGRTPRTQRFGDSLMAPS